jgi:sugar phosphate isomerase/epimerase
MSTQPDQSRFAVSTWSLHRTLGTPPITGPETPEAPTAAPATDALPLLEVPARLREFGIPKLEICHFHLPSREPAYLRQLRTALADAGITLWQFLIDGGDITHPRYADRDIAWIQGWIDTAAALGATRARVSAGRAQPTPANFALSKAALAELADYAAQRNVRLMTENWQTLLATPEAVFAVLDGLDHVGLLADLGNWGGPTKYDDLAQILPRAESCHAKAHFTAPADEDAPIDAGMDRVDYTRCLELCQAAGFSGPYSLIYDGPNPNEWAGLRAEMAVVTAYL